MMYPMSDADQVSWKGIRFQIKYLVCNSNWDKLDKERYIRTLEVHPHRKNKTEEKIRRFSQGRQNQSDAILENSNVKKKFRDGHVVRDQSQLKINEVWWTYVRFSVKNR